MIYLDVDLNSFAKEWELPLDQKFKCPECENEFLINIPVYTHYSAGLVSPEHGCKNMYSFIGTPRTEAAKKFWEQIV